MEDSDDKLPVFVLNGEVPQPPIILMSLNGSPVDFELETGAAVTIMSEVKFLSALPRTATRTFVNRTEDVLETQ